MPVKVELDRVPVARAFRPGSHVRNRVNEEVIRGVAEAPLRSQENFFESQGHVVDQFVTYLRKTVVMVPRGKEDLEGKTRCEGSHGYEVFAGYDDALAGVELLLDQVAEQAAFL